MGARSTRFDAVITLPLGRLLSDLSATMASFGSAPFVSVAKHPDALQLDGDRAANPLKAGQTIIAHGMFEDQSETAAGYFVVLRSSAKHHTYELAPIGCLDSYWGEHLKGKPSVVAKVMARSGEKVGGTTELLTRWRVVSGPNDKPPPESLEGLGKRGADDAVKKWCFLADYVVTEAQAGNDIPPR